ncbi:MAG: hypothetical protein KatS3mg035_2169 [Bacteroidia bacterium]|nr:MAG: hypothetical protein KatS3mg035_2169 [Bacteroidia bacterium]
MNNTINDAESLIKILEFHKNNELYRTWKELSQKLPIIIAVNNKTWKTEILMRPEDLAKIVELRDSSDLTKNQRIELQCARHFLALTGVHI